MPQIESEIPGEKELNNYFQVHWTEFVNACNGWFVEYGINGTKLLEKVHDSMWNSLLRLNKLPRDDDFWDNTNNRPTIYKLTEFCEKILKENPEDSLALWTLFSLSYFNGHRITLQNLKFLSKVNNFDVELLVLWFLLENLTFASNSDNFSEILSALNLKEQSKPILFEYTQVENNEVSDWAITVLKTF